MSLNVLIVDDSAVMRTIITRTLKKSGLELAEVYQASNAFDALEILSNAEVDLALIDINMDVMNGEQLLTKLREDPKTARLAVIVISTEGSTTRIERLEQLGAGFV